MAEDDPAAQLADALATGQEWDLGGASIPAALLVSVLTAPPPPGAPALRLRRATVTGVLRMTGAHVGVPVEMRGCLFAHAPDLRTAEFTGLALTGCRVPGLRAGNLRVAADLLLDDGFTAHGPVNLTDAHGPHRIPRHRRRPARVRPRGDPAARGPRWHRRPVRLPRGGRVHVDGNLELDDGLSTEGTGITLCAPDGYAMLADRLRIGGEFYLRTMRCQGTVRLQNAEIGATLDCTGSVLDRPRLRPDGTVRPSLDARASIVGKDLLCNAGFTATRCG